MGLVNLQIVYTTVSAYLSLPEEERLSSNKIYFVRGNDSNYLYAKGRCYGQVGNGDGSGVQLIHIKNEIELPSIGSNKAIYVTSDGTIYLWNDEDLRWHNGISSWECIEWIKGNGKE